MIRLLLTNSAEQQWQEVVQPWFHEQARGAELRPERTVLLTPGRALGFYYRARWAAERRGLLGVHFWTPSDTRTFLSARLLPQLQTLDRAEERLLARICAQELLDAAPEQPLLASVVREPSAFCRSTDLLLGAGWDPARVGSSFGEKLAACYQARLERAVRRTQAGTHRLLGAAAEARAATSPPKPLIDTLLLVGFTAFHWPLWDLLRAITRGARRVSVALTAPEHLGFSADELWINSWEAWSQTGTEERPPLPAAPPLSSLADSYRLGDAAGATRGAASPPLRFLVQRDEFSLAESLFNQALRWLSDPACLRLGLAFPASGAVSLRVAELLTQAEIPFDDGLGAIRLGPGEAAEWQAWLALQETPSVARLIDWLRALETGGCSDRLPPHLNSRQVADLLDQKLAETLLDDLGFLARHLFESSHRPADLALATWLQQRLQLPPRATLEAFLAQTRQARAGLPPEPILAPATPWLGPVALSRTVFLAYLREANETREPVRGALGGHFYGRVHLLAYAHLADQTWSHLILSGLNQGVWPRDEATIGSRYEWEQLNAQARTLNRRGQTAGAAGIETPVVRPGHGHCLLPEEREALFQRDLVRAIESTSHGLSLAALTHPGGRRGLPSNFFTHFYQLQTGTNLTEAAFQQMAHPADAETSVAGNAPAPAPEIEEPSAAATRTAYCARRRSGPFGPYEFSYAAPPDRPLRLSCRAWEEAWHNPAAAWLREVVKVEPWPEMVVSWPRALGTWVHRWLGRALEQHRGKPDLATNLAAEVAHFRDTVGRQATASGLLLPPWWEPLVAHAASLAQSFLPALEPLLPGCEILSEFRLPPELRLVLPASGKGPPRELPLHGRLDLLLLSATPESDLPLFSRGTGRAATILDFKTGKSRPLSTERLAQGFGLQVLLYAAALRVWDADPVRFGLLFPHGRAPNLPELASLLELPILRQIEAMHRTGVFGQRPAQGPADRAGSARFPLTTRSVPAALLAEKWQQTHGVTAAAEDPEEES